MKTISSQSRLVTLVLFFDLILNILVQLIPDTIKSHLTGYVALFGLTYTTFWLILTSIIVLIILFISIKKNKSDKISEQSMNKKATKRIVNQFGDKSVYIEKNQGDFKVE
jgi:uncharacterized membrane protein YdjX (TVP38/TMEM64 family)